MTGSYQYPAWECEDWSDVCAVCEQPKFLVGVMETRFKRQVPEGQAVHVDRCSGCGRILAYVRAQSLLAGRGAARIQREADEARFRAEREAQREGWHAWRASLVAE